MQKWFIGGLVMISAASFGQIPADANPKKLVKLHPDELMRVVKFGGVTAYGKYRNILVLKKDGTVIDKAWNTSYSFKLNDKQWDDWKTNLEYLNEKEFTRKGEGDKWRPDRTEFYVELRIKGHVFRWSSVGRPEPWPAPLFDTTDVWEYLCKNP